jgi:transposase
MLLSSILLEVHMGRSKGAIDEETALRAQHELEIIKDSSLVIKLQAIISCAIHPVNLVASVLGKDRVTLWRWIRIFKEQGVSGFTDKPKGHNPAKLNADQKLIVYQWIDRGKNAQGEVTHWTLKKLSMEIEEELGVKMTKTPLWLMVRAMGFRQKVPRRTHVLADKEKQVAFKKNR